MNTGSGPFRSNARGKGHFLQQALAEIGAIAEHGLEQRSALWIGGELNGEISQ